MNFSYQKSLKIHNHSYFDFVDINPDSDQAFYLDAEQISLCDDKYSRNATKAIDSFFYSLCEAAQNRDYNRLLNLCSFCGEVNMTHLGLSLKSSKGKGSSPQIIMKIVDGMISHGLFENESVTRFSDLSLLTPNFDKDRSSDLITNIIQNILYQFTVDQYKHWNLPLSNSLFSLHYWDPDTRAWKKEYVPAPTCAGQIILLTPKWFVREKLLLSTEEIFYKYILKYRQNEHLDSQSNLCRKKIDNKGNVSYLPPSKKTLKKIEYADIRRKDILIESTNKYPNLLDIYHRDMEYRNCIGKILIDDDTFDRILYNLSEENIS